MALSIRKMAAALGVGKSQVARDAAAGMPMDSPEAAQAWRAQNRDVARTAEGRIDRTPPATLPTAPSDPGDDDKPTPTDTEDYRKARTEREQVRLARERMELDQARGAVIDAPEAARLAFTAFRTLRDAVLNVPAREAPLLAAETDPFKIEQLLYAALSEALGAVQQDRLLTEPDADDDAD
jgi:hypothetical protein